LAVYYTIDAEMPTKKHDDTSISLHPFSFEEAVKKLTNIPPALASLSAR